MPKHAEGESTVSAPSQIPFRSARYAVVTNLYHNTSPSAVTVGYSAETDEVAEVYAYYQHDVPNSVSDLDLAGQIIESFGVVPDPADRAADHRVANYVDRGNRPLARGDVIAIDHRYYALTETGFTPIARPRTATSGQPLPAGTTRL
ncbi:hypothetical protein [Nocardia miyunensis]|uniref:hypothetical protein n=1 Tax=Nocardia miyunensis TaxID=282684 RepID=UPI00083364AA|nr:hypothetical protein [Nocardia miyunensis]